MKTLNFNVLLVALALFLIVGCSKQTDVVDSGTYTGTVDKVEPEKTEIYVQTADDKRLELYFNENTELTQNGSVVPFEALEKGQKVEVTVEKVGQRLEPIAVNIID